MAAERLVGVDDPETGGVTVRRLVEEDGKRYLRATYWHLFRPRGRRRD